MRSQRFAVPRPIPLPIRTLFASRLRLPACAVACLVAWLPAKADLVAHFRFDETGGTTATNSVGGVNGTLSPSGAQFVADGVTGNALYLERAANGFVDVGNTFGFTEGDFSVVAWVKTAPGDTTDTMVIVGKHESGYDTGYFLFLNQTAGGAAGQNGKASFYAGELYQTVTSATDVNDGEWHQVAVLCRAGQSKVILVDGVEAGEAPTTAPVAGNDAPFLVGGVNVWASPMGLFTGWIDDLQLYDAALSPDHVAFLFKHPGKEIKKEHRPHPAYPVHPAHPTVPAKPALAHWTFDESSGDTARDGVDGFDGMLSPTGAEFVPGGVSGNALYLDRTANGYVEIGPYFGFTKGDFSIVAWVKTLENDLSNDTIVLGKHEAGVPNGYFVFLNQTASGTIGQPGKASFFGGALEQSTTSTTSVTDGAWHQIVAVWQAGLGKTIYVDGSPAEATQPDLPIAGNAASFIIGGVSIGGMPTGLFTGWIDELQLYDVALSAEDVDALYARPAKELHDARPVQPDKPALAHWNFDEATGDVAHDNVGGWDGVLSPSGASFVAGGVSGNALYLDRGLGGFVSMGDVFGFTGGDFTMVSWVKTEPGEPADDSVLIGKQQAGYENGYLLFLNQTGYGAIGQPGKVSFYGTGQPQTVTSTTTVNDGQWHQVVVVYRAGTDKTIYVDGAPAEASQPNVPVIGNTAAFMIGGVEFEGVPGGLFTGWIDEVQLYDVALTDSEIDHLFAHPSAEITRSMR